MSFFIKNKDFFKKKFSLGELWKDDNLFAVVVSLLHKE
jgi:hypothetical protein